MEHSPAHIVLRHLQAGGMADSSAGSGAWPITYGVMPDTPDNALCVYNTDGRMDGRLMRSGTVIEHPGIQIKVRAQKDAAAHGKARVIADFLDATFQAPVAIDGKNYTIQAYHRTTPVLALGQDESQRRVLYTINATITVREN